MDPLSLVTDLLVVVVIDADAFDALFPQIVASNTEGEVINGQGGVAGVPFTESTVRRFVEVEPMQAAGTALLQLAWEHRHRLDLQ